MATAPKIARFWIDTDVCLDQRSCVIEAPDLLHERAQAGGPLIASTELDTDAKVLQILNATWACPVSAFRVEFEDGSVHDGTGAYIRNLCEELNA
jgi:ferredoxin